MYRVCQCIMLSLFVSLVSSYADPYPKESAVVKNIRDIQPRIFATLEKMPLAKIKTIDIVRIEIAWVKSTDSYKFSQAVIENSGTQALLQRTQHKDKHGSYHGMLVDLGTNQALYFNSLGTGQQYRKLTRAFTFRFPIPDKVVEFRMLAENPTTGEMEEVLRRVIDPKTLEKLDLSEVKKNLEVRLLKEASKEPKVVVNIYAEGYQEHRKGQFWQDASKLVDRLQGKDFPMVAHMQFHAVFAPSKITLGKAKDLGFPIPKRDTFLGLYYPYWDNFGRWYHVIYPTRESHFRSHIGLVPYDYPIVLVDSSSYWGVGNFKEHTAIPSRSNSFTYLLLHEFGHYFGLNEEYDSGGKTELAFAPGIKEPWSQNITFLSDPNNPKWKQLIDSKTPVPTPNHYWQGKGPYGIYRGGYAQTPPLGKSYKPGLGCVMHSGGNFCPICRRAIKQRILFDLGKGK